MRMLITGNMGYVGPVVIRHLRATYPYATLIGLDAGLFGHCLTSQELPERLLDRQIYADIRDVTPQMLEDVDAVVHLAAVSNDPMGSRFAEQTDAINHRASVRLAGLARDAGARAFVFASSCSVYGAAGDAPRTEADPVNPLTAYARSKIDTERDLAVMDRGDMIVTCLRFATACGMSDRIRLDLVLNDFVACALAERRISILSDGTPWRPLIDVSDMARAIDWACHRDPAAGGDCLVVNVGADRWNNQVADLARAVSAAIPGTSMTMNPDAPPDKRSYRVDFSRFAALAPDHQPHMQLAGSIARIRDGLQAIGFADPLFRQGSFIRLHVLDRLIGSGRLADSIRWRDTAAQPATAILQDAE